MSDWETAGEGSWETAQSSDGWETASQSSTIISNKQPVDLHTVNQGIPRYNKDIEHNNLLQDLSEGVVDDMTKYGIINGLLRGPIEAGWNLTGGGIAGMVGGPLNLANEAVKSLITGKDFKAEDAFAEGMAIPMIEPKTKVGSYLQEKVINPVMENLVPIMPMMGGLAVHPTKALPKVSNVETPKEVFKYTDKDFAQKALYRVNKELDIVQSLVSDISDAGIFKEGDTRLQALEAKHQELQNKQRSLIDIINGVEPNEVGINKDIANIQGRETINRIKQETRDRMTPEEKAVASKHALTEEESIRKADEIALSKPEKTPYEIVEEARQEPKTSPTQIALEKIGEAKDMTKGELADHILNTEDKLNSIDDIPENSSIRENIKQELKAYDDIQKGKEPDLSWFEGKQEIPTLEGIIVEEIHPELTISVEAPKPTFNKISDIYNHQGDIVSDLLTNNHFFNRRENSQVYFDKTFQDSVFGKVAEKVINHFLDVTGLSKDNIFISFDDSLGNTSGRVNHIGDTTHIKLNPESFKKLTSGKGVDYGVLKGKALENAKTAYAAVRIAAHEIGHVVLNKYLRTFIQNYSNFDTLVKDFDVYRKDNKLTNISGVDFWKGETSAKAYADAQKHFHEYFAERTANELLNKHALGAFSKGRGKVFKSLLDASIRTLEKHGIIVNKPAFMDDVISNLLDGSKSTIKATGDSMWEVLDTHRNNQLLNSNEKAGEFAGLTLQQIVNDPKVKTICKIKNGDLNPFLGLDTNDTPSMSTKLLNYLGSGVRSYIREFHGRAGVAAFDPNNPTVQSTYHKMRELDIKVEALQNEIMYGKQNLDKIKWTETFSKIKNADSPYIAIRDASNLDFAILHDLFKKGFDENLPFKDNLEKNKQHLTERQVKYYDTLSKALDKMYDQKESILEQLGKKATLNKRNGYYPASRIGRYSISINYGDVTAHVEQFQTRLMAEKRLEQIKSLGLKHFDVSDIINLKDKPKVISNMDIAESVVDTFSRLFPQAKMILDEREQRLLQSMVERGGKFGQHHKYRSNVSGYKGSELFTSREELGKSFKDAFEQSISEHGMQVKQMLYKHNFDLLLENKEFQERTPNSYDAVKQMYDSSLGRVENKVDNLEGTLAYKLDKAIDSALQVIGKEKKTDISAGNIMFSHVVETFSLLKMMPKFVFATIGQILSVPPIAIAKMSKGNHSLLAYKSFGSGVLKLISGDKVLWDSIKEVSQSTNTFEAQFMEALSLYKHESAFLKATKDYALLRAPGKVSEAGSRILAYAVFHDYYTALGMKPEQVKTNSIRAVGESLNLYDKANSAPIFSHLGFVGKALAPLQGFGQNQLGQVVGMVREMSASEVRSAMPLVNFTLMTVVMTGVMGLPFIQEYEKLRKLLEQKGIFSLPSILDVVKNQDDGIQRILPMSEEASNAVLLGLPSLSGYDLSVSARSNESFPTLVLGMLSGNEAPMDTMPLLQWASRVPGATVDIGNGIAGNATQTEVRKAFDVLAPSGHMGYGIKKTAGVMNPTIFGKNTPNKVVGLDASAGDIETQQDINAELMGTKTTKGKVREMLDFQQTEQEKFRSNKIKQNFTKFVEQGDPKYLARLAREGVTQEQMENEIGTEVYKRTVPLHIRMMFGKNGKLISGRGTRAAINFSKY